MDNEAVGEATARIDRALGRIETAARMVAADHAALALRHERLRDTITAAITALDQEIANDRSPVEAS